MEDGKIANPVKMLRGRQTKHRMQGNWNPARSPPLHPDKLRNMLQEQEIRQILQERKKKGIISRAIAHQDRIRFHCELTLDKASTSAVINDFLLWIRGRRTPDKYNRFLSLFRFPVKTVRETSKIFDLLARVFDGQNSLYRYDFTNPDYAEDWQEYRNNVLEVDDKWKCGGMEILKLAINSVVIADLPKDQKTALPEPYFYFLDISNVLEFQEDRNGDMLYIIFRVNEKEVAVIDDYSYRIFETKEKDDTNIGALVSEARHDLTYCPATFFWKKSISMRDTGVKASPVSAHLDALDTLLEKMVSVAHLDDYASYPILATYKVNCDYISEGSHGVYTCDTGFLRDQESKYVMLRDGALMPCPKCNSSMFAGPGSLLRVPFPEGGASADGMRNPVQVIGADVPTLQYNVDEIERQKRAIIQDITGYADEPINDQAVNEKQVRAMFETQTRVLREIKKDLETVIEWTEFTLCRLRYGKYFESCSIDLGTDFYLYDAQTVLSVYTDAQKAELDDSILDFLQDQYFETLYRNNPEALRRQKILNHLDPFRHLTKSTVTSLYEGGRIKYDQWYLKLNFSTFVLRFEREQASLLKFGTSLSFDTRIEKIKNILLIYGKENKPEPITVGN